MKKSLISRIIACVILFIATTIVVSTFIDNWRFNPWMPVIYGALVIPIMFPPIIKWAKSTMKEHKAVSTGLLILLSFWTLSWLVYTLLTILGVAK